MKTFFKQITSLLCIMATLLTFVGCKDRNNLSKQSKNLTNYTIESSLNDTEKTFTSLETVDYINNSLIDLNFLCFHLYPNAFREDAVIKPYTTLNSDRCFPNGKSFGNIDIISVKSNAADLAFEITGTDKNILKVTLPIVLKPTERVVVSIEFSLVVPNCTHRFGYSENVISLSNWYPIVCEIVGEDFDTTPYYSTGDPFFSASANYKVSLTYPSIYQLGSTGNETSQNISADSTLSVITANVVRDFAICLTKNFSKVTSVVDDISVNVFALNSDDSIQDYLKVSTESVMTFNKLYGNYPYSKLDILLVPFLHGGMEFPNLVLISDDVEKLIDRQKIIVHEIAHQWFYSVLGNNEIKDAWIDESLAEYSTIVFFEQNSSYGLDKTAMIKANKDDYMLYVDVINSLNVDYNKSMELAINEYKNEYEYVYMVYVKGTLMLDDLRSKVGDDKFFRALKDFYEDNKFGIVTKLEFVKAFNDQFGADISEYLNEWLSGAVVVE